MTQTGKMSEKRKQNNLAYLKYMQYLLYVEYLAHKWKRILFQGNNHGKSDT